MMGMGLCHVRGVAPVRKWARTPNREWGSYGEQAPGCATRLWAGGYTRASVPFAWGVGGLRPAVQGLGLWQAVIRISYIMANHHPLVVRSQ